MLNPIERYGNPLIHANYDKPEVQKSTSKEKNHAIKATFPTNTGKQFKKNTNSKSNHGSIDICV